VASMRSVCGGFLVSFGLWACAPRPNAPAASSPPASGAASGLRPESGPVSGPATGAGPASDDSGPRASSSPQRAHEGIPYASDVDAGQVPPRGHDPGRAPEDIRAIIVAHRDEARRCYEKALVSHPGIEGDLIVRWTIDPKGVVTQASSDLARSQIVEPSIVACITDIILKIQFAPSQRGFETRAFYPFNFHPRRGGRDGGSP
jgi:hypothetical protein